MEPDLLNWDGKKYTFEDLDENREEDGGNNIFNINICQEKSNHETIHMLEIIEQLRAELEDKAFCIDHQTE